MSRSFGYRQFAEDVVALLDQLGIERIAIVGWSDGAITGLELAMAKPERVSKLFAFGASKTVEGLKPTGSRSRTFAMFVECCPTPDPSRPRLRREPRGPITTAPYWYQILGVLALRRDASDRRSLGERHHA
jgi:pimeloyl-ACP methyl ester carboxylesterase